MKYLFLLMLFSCASYTDPEQEKITYYKCEKSREIVVKHSDDYESIVIKYGDNIQVLLHHFVTATDDGYRNEKLLWLTKGKKAVLIEKFEDGSENELFKDCKAEKQKLQY